MEGCRDGRMKGWKDRGRRFEWMEGYSRGRKGGTMEG